MAKGVKRQHKSVFPALLSALVEFIPGDILKKVKTAMLFTQGESRRYRISCVAEGSQ
jgi:hypothetical protein